MTFRRAAFLSFLVVSLLSARSDSVLAAKGGPPKTGEKQEGKAVRDDSAVARWGNDRILASELKDFVIGRMGMAMRHGRKVTLDEVRALLNEMIGNQILNAEAGKPEIFTDPRFTGAYALASAREVANLYVKEVLGKRFAVTDEEAAAEMPKRRDVARIQQVVVPTREEAQEVLDKVRGGMPFDEAIQKYSIVKTAAGAFTEIREDYDLIDEVSRKTILDMGQGEITGILPTRIGHAVVLVVEKLSIDDAGWKAILEDRKRRVFERKVARHYEEIMRGGKWELFDPDLKTAVGEDFEFRPAHRAVMALDGEKVFFDDYMRSRDVHLRDTIRTSSVLDLYNAYRAEFENLPVVIRLSKAAAAEKGWTEPEGKRRDQLRDSIARKVFGERIFAGISAEEEEIRKEYDGNAPAFTVKKRYKARRLTFRSFDEAKKFRKTVKKPKDFYDQVKQKETKEDRYENNFFEWKNFDRLDEKTKKAFGQTKKGKLTEPIEGSKKQFYLFFIEEIEKNYRIPYEEVRLNIKRAILRRKQEAKLSEIVRDQLGKTKVEFFDESIRKVAEQVNKGKKHAPAS